MKRTKKKKKATKGRIKFHQPWLQNDADRIARWNAQFPIGTMVVYERDNKQKVRSRTTSMAFKDHPHGPVLIHLTGQQSAVLARVTAIEKGRLDAENTAENRSRLTSAPRPVVPPQLTRTGKTNLPIR